MSHGSVEISVLTPLQATGYVPGLAEILVECVDGGASVGFMAPLSLNVAEAFWSRVAEGVSNNDRLLIAAFVDGAIAGTVQVVYAGPENQPHRADIAKMLVRPRFRNRGLGAQLLTYAQEQTRLAGKTVLVLDTVFDGAGERLYKRLGWTRVGEVPNFALMPSGEPCTTVYFYKHLGADQN